MMGQFARRPLIVCAVLVGLAGPTRAELDAYLKREDGSFAWSNRASTETEQGRVTDLELTSQTWQGIVWKHRVRIYEPMEIEHPDAMLLFISGGSHESQHDADEDALAFAMANLASARVAVLPQVPNQPLLGDKREDTLIAETFVRYLDSGDATWPLLFPMVKSAVRAMDALQAWATEKRDLEVRRFVVTGASKRGWTTWLTAVSDPRVVAIAPMVIDVLNFPAQKAKWFADYGGPSEHVQDYTNRGLIDAMDRPEGRRLWSLVDPYVHRDRLTMPKLVILGTNDPYWTVDALNVYWHGLQGPKNVVYLPNAGHGLEENRPYALEGIGAICRTALAGQTLPQLTCALEDGGDFVLFRARSPEAPKSARIWVAESTGKDFRSSVWIEQPVPESGNAFEVELKRPESGSKAVLADLEFEWRGRGYHISTPIQVFGAAKK